MTTVQNFAVPLDGQRGSIIMPKPKNRFRVRVFNFGPVSGGLDFTQNVQTCNRPNMQHAEHEVHSFNSTGYYAGKVTWSPLEIALRDDVTGAVAKLVFYQMQKQQNHLQQTTPLAGVNYMFDTKVDTLDGGDAVLETVHYEGCFIQSYNGGDWDYSTADPSTLTLSIRFQNCTAEGDLMPLNPVLSMGSTLN
jgi:hypothetical protein